MAQSTIQCSYLPTVSRKTVLYPSWGVTRQSDLYQWGSKVPNDHPGSSTQQWKFHHCEGLEDILLATWSAIWSQTQVHIACTESLSCAANTWWDSGEFDSCKLRICPKVERLPKISARSDTRCDGDSRFMIRAGVRALEETHFLPDMRNIEVVFDLLI